MLARFGSGKSSNGLLFLHILFHMCYQAKDYGSLVVFCIFFGLSYGMVGALQFEVLMAIVGTEKFSSAIGLVLLMEAIAVLVGPPGAGQSVQRCLKVFADGKLLSCSNTKTRRAASCLACLF